MSIKHKYKECKIYNILKPVRTAPAKPCFCVYYVRLSIYRNHENLVKKLMYKIMK
jgi:hypothetical protein